MTRPRVPRITVTAGGRAAVVLAVLGWTLGLTLGWVELVYLGAASTLVVLLGLLSIVVPRRASATLEAHPARTTVGRDLRVELAVRGGAVPMVSPVVRVLGDVGAQTLRLPPVLPGRTRQEVFEEHASHRGIFELGPVLHDQSDLLGLFRRTRSWGASSTLWVRPRVVVPDAFSLGGVFDLEGLPSDQMSMSDLAFHALREYVPGDDLRNVHWRSSAKADTLLVRQYLESRTLHAAVVVDDDARAYATPEEFETAISVAASLSLRALADGFEVDLACGPRVASPSAGEGLLDECCHYALAGGGVQPADVGHRARQLARTGSAVGVGIVVSGSTCDLERLLEATAAFGGDAQRIAVRVDHAGEGTVRKTHGVRVLEVANLEELPRLAAWVSA